MTTRMIARGVAILIAILGMVDPAITLETPVRRPLIVAVDHGVASAASSAARLRDLLTADYNVRLRQVGARDAALACTPGMPCILVGGTQWPGAASDGLAPIVGIVRIEQAVVAGVTIADVSTPASVNAGAVARMVVELTGHGITGQQSTVDVLDDDVPVGRAVHEWTEDGGATVPIDWWPIGGSLRRLSIRATHDTDDGRAVDDRADVGVSVGAEPYRVLVYDARPSWTSTFVRRAVEQDTRLALRVMARLGPQLQVTAGESFRLDDRTLDEASVVVVGTPDDLSAREVDTLERFVRLRGGSLILVPDRRPAGPVTRLLPSRIAERLEPEPVPVGEWRASELLLFRDLRAGSSVLATAGADAVVVAAPTGAGRVIVSGAMDAWRYRDDDDDRFDRAWRSLLADAARAGGRPLEAALDRSVVRPSEEVRLTVALRAMAQVDAGVSVGATIACGDEQPRVLRLWPRGERRQFEGRFAPTTPGRCRIVVSADAPIVARQIVEVVVADDAQHPRQDPARGGRGSDPMTMTATGTTLERIAAASGARVVAGGDETTLAGDVRRLVPVESAPSRVRPMRSPWWIFPFAGCLGLEWWLRRRHGLR